MKIMNFDNIPATLSSSLAGPSKKNQSSEDAHATKSEKMRDAFAG